MALARARNGQFKKGGVRRRSHGRSTALARRGSTAMVRRGHRAGTRVRHAARKVGRSIKHHARRARGFFAGFAGGAGLKGGIKSAVPHAIVAAIGFVAVRFGTRLILGTRADGTRRDSGWLGYVGNGVAAVAGYWLLRKFAPRFATAFLIGAGASIALRAFSRFLPEHAESAGLSGEMDDSLPAGGQPGSDAEGVQGVYRNMRGVYQREAA